MADGRRRSSPSARYDIGTANSIRLPYNKCGCVYKINLNYNYNAYAMSALTCGVANSTAATDGTKVGVSDNTCSLSGAPLALSASLAD